MLIKKPADLRYSDITPKLVFLNRRKFLAGVPAAFLTGRELLLPSAQARAAKLANLTPSKLSTLDEKPNSINDATTYNNYYEFGTQKDQPARLAREFRTHPWT